MVYFYRQFNGSLVAEVRNGALLVCPPGCADCNCTSCLLGFSYDNSTGLCKRCPLGCLSCYKSPYNSSLLSCSFCKIGHYFDFMASSCGLCGSSCLSCGGMGPN